MACRTYWWSTTGQISSCDSSCHVVACRLPRCWRNALLSKMRRQLACQLQCFSGSVILCGMGLETLRVYRSCIWIKISSCSSCAGPLVVAYLLAVPINDTEHGACMILLATPVTSEQPWLSWRRVPSTANLQLRFIAH
jgi:hypothetical protein